jgi:hypothetical protein
MHKASGNREKREIYQRLETHSVLALKELRAFLIFFPSD